jgi:hypothetical protein
VNWLRRTLSVVLILGLMLGTMGRAAQTGAMAGMHETAAADHGGMPCSDGCPPGEDTGKGMSMAGCQGCSCVVAPGSLPSSPGGVSLASDGYDAMAPTVPNGRSLPPDHPPPIVASPA